MNRLAGALALGCCLLSASLAKAAADPPGAMVEVEGGQVYTESCGSGAEALLLIHDGVLHSAGFDAIWPALCRRYHVVRFDRRGFGRSPEARAEYSGGDDILAVLHAAGLSHATVLGASNGGAAALAFALDHPEAVDRLVLVGPEFGLPASEHFLNLGKARLAAFRRSGVAAALTADPYVTAPDHAEARGEAVALLVANPQNITHRDRHRPAAALIPRLGQLKAPILILVGEHDAPDLQAGAGALEVLAPGARHVVMPDAGHMIYLEQPQAFVDEVAGFISKTRPVNGR